MSISTVIRIELPLPEGRTPDGSLYWTLSNGEKIFAVGGVVYTPGMPSHTEHSTNALEADAAAYLAAVAYAREERNVRL